MGASSQRVWAGKIAAGLAAGVGIALVIAAAVIDNAWVDRHFLPDYFHPQRRHELASMARLLAALGGVAALVWLRAYVGRVVAARRGVACAGRVLSVVVAIALALLASEGLLRTSLFKARHEAHAADREPRQQRDPRLGWMLEPNHVGQRFIGGRTIEYVTDTFGHRVLCSTCAVDPRRPSVLFTGESIMLGTGLQWVESVPGVIEQRLGVQSVNLSVEGYANDQAYSRLASELARFERPVAVVSLFMPSLFARNLQRDRPYLDATLRWHRAIVPWRLAALANRLISYTSTDDLERGIAMTRAVLQATTRLAQSRQAVSLVLVPRFLPEAAIEAELRHRVLDAAHIDYVLVDLAASWRLSDDRHPNARGACAMASAIAARLETLGIEPKREPATTAAVQCPGADLPSDKS